MSDWIHVADGLPEMTLESSFEDIDGSVIDYFVSSPVLVYNGGYHIAHLEQGAIGLFWTQEEGGDVRGVTHWMSLPEEPEEEPT